MNLITISPGHYGIGTGARDLIDEVREARKVTNRIVEILKSRNIGVTKIEDNRSRTQSQNLDYLVSQHNNTTRKVDVSVHFNTSGGTVNQGLGTEVLYYSDDNKTLADRMSEAIATASGLKNRGGKKRPELAILSRTTKPAILIEVCFVNSVTDVNIYQDKFESICQAISSVLIQYVGGQTQTTDGSNNNALVPINSNGKITPSITSPTLISTINEMVKDKETLKSIIQKGISEGAIDESWQNKLDNNTLTTADLLGLALLMVTNNL